MTKQDLCLRVNVVHNKHFKDNSLELRYNPSVDGAQRRD